MGRHIFASSVRVRSHGPGYLCLVREGKRNGLISRGFTMTTVIDVQDKVSGSGGLGFRV
jgi:hypothetical protein